jgi:hypothetical protein
MAFCTVSETGYKRSPLAAAVITAFLIFIYDDLVLDVWKDFI